MIRLAGGILPIALDNKKICLAWRSPKVHDGNRWNTIGGMCKSGKSPKEAAVEELAEETGYSGAIELRDAFVYQLKGFVYHNFIGIVPTAFNFVPKEKYAWETSFIEWMPYLQIVTLIKQKPRTFHKGVIRLFEESRELIEKFV